MSDRYKVIKGSDSGHCCFDYTVVDSHHPSRHEEYGRRVCECFEEQDARLIADLLNKQGSQANG